MRDSFTSTVRALPHANPNLTLTLTAIVAQTRFLRTVKCTRICMLTTTKGLCSWQMM